MSVDLKAIIEKLDKKKEELAKVRDDLRSLEDEVMEYAELSEVACDDLTSCIETLSTLV